MAANPAKTINSSEINSWEKEGQRSWVTHFIGIGYYDYKGIIPGQKTLSFPHNLKI